MQNEDTEIQYLELISIQLELSQKAEDSCPRATKDISVNLKNRKKAIDSAMYGPLNPSEENEEYWNKLGEEWDVDSGQAKKQLCGNCALFIVSPSMKKCISDGLTDDKDEWNAIDEAGELGYCEAFDFKCASKRTCRAWVVGGPITSDKKEEKSEDIDSLPVYDEYYSISSVLVNEKSDAIEEKIEKYILEINDEKSLNKWFKEKWVDISRPKAGGGFEPCGRNDADSGKYPKCVPASKAARMTQKEIDSAVRRKRKAESTQKRTDKKPIYVSTDKKTAEIFDTEEKGATPTNPELYARVKAEAKKKFDVYPSAYANAWLVREYKKRGGKYSEAKKSAIIGTENKGANSKNKLKNPKGGLTAAGRAFFKRTQGSNLKPGVKGAADTPEKMRRKGSFLTRFFTNPSGPMKDEKGRSTRLALSAAAWGEPVPQDAQAAAKLAAKGRRLLARYEASKNKK